MFILLRMRIIFPKLWPEGCESMGERLSRMVYSKFEFGFLAFPLCEAIDYLPRTLAGKVKCVWQIVVMVSAAYMVNMQLGSGCF